MKTALVTGIRGQLASYLTEFLLDKGYTVVGLERRVSSPDYSNLNTVLKHERLILEQGDICDFGSMVRLLKKYKVDEFYNLAAQSFVAASWDQPITTSEVNYMGVCNCLEAIRLVSPKTKFYQSSTSECFGDVLTDTQNELTEARPRSPYGASKLAAEGVLKVYKDSYDIFACYSRNFNFESPRRGQQFVTRKITYAIGEMVKTCGITSFEDGTSQSDLQYALDHGLIMPIRLGNLDAKRDWTHAKDIVRGIYLMMQRSQPENYVLASGETRSIKDFLDLAFSIVGVEDWKNFVVIDPKFYRPAEVHLLCGDYSKALKDLKWEPEISFYDLVKEMIYQDSYALSDLSMVTSNVQ